MYIKKVQGPRTMKLPNGSFMTRADLPPKSTKRWVASRKAAVVKAARFGPILLDEACNLYGLSNDEYTS
jgi:hypothetical protein